jgi:hypothetical protein
MAGKRPPIPRVVHKGAVGRDVLAYKLLAKRAGYYVPKLNPLLYNSLRYRTFGDGLAQAINGLQARHNFHRDGVIDEPIYEQLIDDAGVLKPFEKWLIQHTPKPPAPRHYPLANWPHRFIGIPYQGTHLDFHNWESDNAVDLEAPFGTAVLAVTDGIIGSQIGPLDSGNPQLLGLRLHLVAPHQEFYYAHLSSLRVVAGQAVKAGGLLGWSGEANNVDHLHFACEHGDPAIYCGSKTPGYVDRHYPG